MAGYPGSSYLSVPLPGPPPGPPPGPTRNSSHRSQHSLHGPQAPYDQPAQPPYPHSQGATSQPQQMPTIPQQQPISQSQMRNNTYSQPQYLSGSYPPPNHSHLHHYMQGSPMQGSPVQQGYSAPGTPSMHSYPLGEPMYPVRPDLDPRRASHSSHHSARSAASYNSRRSGYGRHSGVDDDWYDSGMDSEEEERRRRRKERHRKKHEDKTRERERPTLGDSMYAIFGGIKNAMGSDHKKY